MNDRKAAEQNISVNRRARHEYHVDETFEAGLELVGTEVKSLRQGKANLQDAYAKVVNGQVWLYGCHISPFEKGNRFNHDPLRERRLLLHKREIAELARKSQERGLALIPLRMYWVKGRAKLELAVCRGKQLHDKRESIKERETKREMDRATRR
ncbi:MAG: SsrA-binding protein SmpB [Armatimonadetes bacterium]|nr:SsrA-binding protein SmpB [Armatimonadota bacterium]